MRKVVAFVAFIAVLLDLACSQPATNPDGKPEIKVPFIATRPAVVEAMLRLAAVKEGETVYDLGCGDGRIVIAAVGQFKAKRGLGLDFDPDRLKDCAAGVQKAVADKKLTAEQAKRLTFKQGDVLKMTPDDFKDVDVVTLYLLPDVNRRLKPVLRKGLKPGARVVSHDFHMGDVGEPDEWKEDKMEEVISDRETHHKVYLWVVKGQK
jgi:SAM-dependent methyltransferase